MLVSGLLSRLRCTCLAALLAFGTAHAQNQPANLVPDHASFTQRTVLPGHRPAWAIPAADCGTLPDAQNVQLTFSLSRSPQVQAAFDQFLADQQDPSSPRFHQWLTPQQAGAQFGPTQHDLDALTTWLTGQGFTVDAVTPSRIFVQVSAPAAIVAAALGTSLHTWQVAYGSVTETMQAPAAEPTLPTAFTPIVSFIGGLTSVPVHIHSRLQAQTATVTSAPGAPHPNLTVGSATNPLHFLTPFDFNKVYDVPAYVTGAGQRVMIVGGSRLSPSDVSYFESSTALPSYAPNIIVDPAYGDPGQTSDGNQGEATLDFNRVFGTAPGAQVDLVIAQNWLNGTVNQNLILYAINTVNDPVLSLSFGACENLQPTGYVKQEDAMYSQAAAQGITTLVSSGDAGVTGCAVHNAAPTASTAYPNINDICASSYVTCIGGTQFNDTANPDSYWSASNGTGFSSVYSYIPEGAWNEPANTASNAATVPYVLAATGGGPSTIIAKPIWQTGTGVPADGARDTPDLSFAAAGHDGYFSCLASAGTAAQDTGCVPIAAAGGGYSFGFVAFSGTSAAAPSMAGVVALLDQKLGGRQGNINPTLYKLAASTPAVFHDATIASSGVLACAAATPNTCNNSTPSSYALIGGVPGYLLQTGYDLATGLGSLDVNAFLTAASVTTLPATTSTLTAAPGAITTAQTVVFTDVLASAPGSSITGTVAFTTNTGLNLGTTILGSTFAVNSASASTAPISFPSAGTYIVTAAYSGSSTAAASSASVTLVVTAPGLPASLTLTPASPTLTTIAGNTASDLITITSLNFTGSANLTCTVTGTGSTASLPGCILSPGSASFTGSGTTTSTLSLTSDKRAALSPSDRSSNSTRSLARLALCTLFALYLPRRTRKLQVFAVLTLTLAVIAGCGSSNFSGSNPAAPTGTAAGQYTVTITAADSANVSASTTIALTIQ